MGNEISVELRLKLQKLRGDAQQAGRQINSDLASSVKGLGPTNQEQQERSERIKRAQRNRDLDKRDADKEAAEKQKQRETELRAMRVSWVKTVAVIVGAFLIIKKMLNEIESAANNARMSYGKIIQSGGLAPAFVIQRQNLANVLGISEQDVMKYGMQIGYLNDKLEWANKVLTDTNPTVTALGWQLKTTETNFKALWATLANDAAPAIEAFLKPINEFIKWMASQKDHPSQAESAQPDRINFWKMLAIKMFGAGNVPDWIKNDVIPGHAAGGVPKAPPAVISPDRLPASSWEKMGLVIGQSGAVNHQKETAKNTGTLVQLTRTLIQNTLPRGNNKQFFENPTYPQP